MPAERIAWVRCHPDKRPVRPTAIPVALRDVHHAPAPPGAGIAEPVRSLFLRDGERATRRTDRVPLLPPGRARREARGEPKE
ncbi:hypothetical protein GCM10010392_30550 [Streptomyces clavifer]|nr:hypothetical protein GCM10010392_30550 [Streptomyces clavifer]